MKITLLSFAALIAVFIGCQSPEEFRAEDPVYGQLLKEAHDRDSAMLELVTTMNLIDEGISNISQKKNELDLNTNDPEFAKNNREKILSDIQGIYELMEENKNKIDELNRRLGDARSKLKKSDADLKHANELIAQYQLMIDNMNKKIEMKDSEIAAMQTQLSKMDISLDSLKTEFTQQKTEMNKVYFAFGTRKELQTNKVIDKSGGFIGIGKSYKLKSDFNRSFFTEANAEELTTVDLMVKKATLLTNHMDGSYHFEGTEPVGKLVIDDQKKFWESSRFLVIEVEQ